MSRSLRLGALQLRAHSRNEYATVADSLFDEIARAARDLDLLVLPEGTFPAYVLGDAHVDDATIEQALNRLRTIAKATACVIVAGVATRRDGNLYNSAVVLDATGEVAGTSDKIFLWAFDRKWFRPGERLEPIKTSVGTLGVMICADGRMPNIARTLVDRGAEILVMPTAWVTSGRNPDALENIQADLLARIRAFENGVPFVAGNKCGGEDDMVLYCGKSQIVAATGAVMEMASQHQPGLVCATVTLGDVLPQRTAFDAPAPMAVREGAERIAFSMRGEPSDLARRLNILDAQRFIAPGDGHALDAQWALDPAFLVSYRTAGGRLAILDARESPPWLELVARARAAELRMYVLVFDHSLDRAYAIDPDGVIIAGTTPDLPIATVPIDYARTALTYVAPGTDVAQGLAFVERIATGGVHA